MHKPQALETPTLSWQQFAVVQAALSCARRIEKEGAQRISSADRAWMRRWIAAAISYAPDPAAVPELAPLIAAIETLDAVDGRRRTLAAGGAR